MINEEVIPCPLLSTFVHFDLLCLLSESTSAVTSLPHFPIITLRLHFCSYCHHNFNDVYHGFSWWSLSYVIIEFLLEVSSSVFTFTAQAINVAGTFSPTPWKESLKKGLDGLASVICPHNRTRSLNGMTHPCGDEAGGLCCLKVQPKAGEMSEITLNQRQGQRLKVDYPVPQKCDKWQLYLFQV